MTLIENIAGARVHYTDVIRTPDDPDLDVDADSVLVLRNAGPLGGPGMPEWGMLPIPKKLLKHGARVNDYEIGSSLTSH